MVVYVVLKNISRTTLPVTIVCCRGCTELRNQGGHVSFKRSQKVGRNNWSGFCVKLLFVG